VVLTGLVEMPVSLMNMINSLPVRQNRGFPRSNDTLSAYNANSLTQMLCGIHIAGTVQWHHIAYDKKGSNRNLDFL
jgi:hypothetical protein